MLINRTEWGGGWSEGQSALYPTQSVGINYNKILIKKMVENRVDGGYFENPNYKFGANCCCKAIPKSNELEKGKKCGRIRANEGWSTREEKNGIKISPFVMMIRSNHSA